MPIALLAVSSAVEVLRSHAAMVARQPMWSIRWIGQRWLEIGVVLLFAGLCLSVPLCHIGFGVALGGALLVRAPLHRLPGFWVALALGLAVVPANLLTPYDSVDGQKFELPGLFYAWLAFYTAAFALTSERVRRWSLIVLIAGVAVSVLLALAQFSIGLDVDKKPWRISSDGEQLMRATGFFSHHIRFGFVMAWASVVLIAGWSVWPLPRLAHLSGVAGGLLGVVLSASRGMLLAVLAGIWTALSLGSWRRAAWSLLVITLLGSGMLMVFHFAFPARTSAMLGGEDVRLKVWHHAVDVIAARPWLGVGTGNFSRAIAEIVPMVPGDEHAWHRTPSHAHNSFLSLAVQYGVPAMLLFVLWQVQVLWALVARAPRSMVAIRLALAVVMVTAIGGSTEDLANLAIPRYALYLGLAFALAIAANSGGDHATRLQNDDPAVLDPNRRSELPRTDVHVG